MSPNFLLAAIYYMCVLPILAQLKPSGDTCATPNSEAGKCVPIRTCAPMMKFLQSAANANTEISQAVSKTLQSYQCGFSRDSVKVCCPKGPIGLPTVQDPPPPDVSRHKNLKHLPLECGVSQPLYRITHGDKTSLFEFPWMALISYQSRNGARSFKCGGSVIHPRYILTAAHCLTELNGLKILGVRVGEYNISSSVDCETIPGSTEKICAPPVQDVAIAEVIPHPSYNSKEFTNDIGLLRLQTPLNVKADNVKPICLPTVGSTRNLNLIGTKLSVTGWGATELGSKSDDLLKANVPVVPRSECQNAYQPSKLTISHKQICAGGKTVQDSCSGDSGGPLQHVLNLRSEVRHVQYGVVSFGPKPCGQINYPGVYTKIEYYLDWILDHLRP